MVKLAEEEKPSGRLALCKLERPKARGGSGIVFKATHSRIMNQSLALKFNRPRTEGDTKILFENELSVLPLMDHFNIIRAIDVGRRYKGGIVKLEPKDLERMPVSISALRTLRGFNQLLHCELWQIWQSCFLTCQ